MAAALVLAGFVTLRVLSRRGSDGAAVSSASQRPGRDVEDPRKPVTGRPDSPAVKGVPMIKLTRPPKRHPRKTVIPAPTPQP